MAPNLITGVFDFAAVYLTSKRLLTVNVIGKMDPFWVNPILVRDPNFVGGLKFNLEGTPDGVPPVGMKAQPINVSTDIPISLPQEWFNSNMRYACLVPPSNDDESSPAKYVLQAEPTTDLSNNLNGLHIGDVLPPIKRFLPDGETLTITAAVPNKPTYPDFSSVKLHFNRFPVGDNNPQLVEVESDTGIQFLPTEIGPPRQVSKIIQGYIISAVVFGPGPVKPPHGNGSA
ncbi:hypothetical protein V8F06_014595 [Rhypophila decipiens]